MDRKGIIAITLSLAVLVYWQIFIAPQYTTYPPTPPAAVTPAPDATPAASPGIAEQAPAAAPSPAAAPEEPLTPEQTETVSSPSVSYTFTTAGGGIARAELLKHKAEHGKNVALNDRGTMPIGAIMERPGEGAGARYTMTAGPGGQSVMFERTTAEGVHI